MDAIYRGEIDWASLSLSLSGPFKDSAYSEIASFDEL